MAVPVRAWCGWLAAARTGPLLCLPVRGEDVTGYWLSKGRSYLQQDASQVVLRPQNAWSFHSDLLGDKSAVFSAYLSTPGGGSIALWQPDGLWYGEGFDTQSGLDSSFPTGRYTLDIVTFNDGATSVFVDLMDSDYPNTPPDLTMAAYYRRTSRTEFTPANPACGQITAPPEGQFKIVLVGAPDRLDTVEFSTDLLHWTNVFKGDAENANLVITNQPPAGSPQGFYRAY